MEEHGGFDFGQYSVEMGDFEFKRVQKFDRIWNYGPGGSFAERPLVHGDIVYVGCMDQNVYALRAQNGEVVWRFRARAGVFGSSPVISGGKIFVGSFDYNLYALDARTGELAWKFPTRGEIMCNPLVHEGRVYVGSKDMVFYCVEERTGKLVWKFRTQGEIASTPSVCGEKVFIGSFDHILYCLDKDDGKLIWKFNTQGEIFNDGGFLIHEGVIYFGSFDNYLRAVDVETGKLLWKFLTGNYGGMGTAAHMHKGTIFQTNREGNFFALTPEGKQVWKFTINHCIANPVFKDDRIYIGSEDRNLYCLDLRGRVLWKFATQGALWWMPAIWHDSVIFTSMDCFVYAVDIKTERLLWKFRGQGAPSFSPPPYESYELSMHVPEKVVEEARKKAYDVGIGDEGEDSGRFYKSRITYQVSSRYHEKGKYQIDSDEEAL
jgi:outer membrane protein assembly factor BamB